MAFITSPVGVDLTVVDTTQEWSLGTRACDNADGEFVYCSFAGTTTAKDFVSIDENHAAAALTTTGVAGEDGQPCGVCQATQTAASFGWVRIKGPETGINVGSSCAANAACNTTATAGRIDDDATSGAFIIQNFVLTTAETAGNAAPGYLNYPNVKDVPI